MWLNVLAWFRRNWAKVAGVMALIGAYLLGAFAKRGKESPDREEIRKEHEAIKKVIAQEEAEYKQKQAEIDKSVADKDKRLDALTKKFGGILLVTLVIFFAAAGPARAEEIPYDTLVTLYEQALDKIADQAAYIADLEAGLREAVDLAKGYRTDWESQKQLTLNAWEMIAYLKAFIENQEKIIEKQWTVIDKLTGSRLTLSIGAALKRSEEGKIEVTPKAELEFVIR